MENENADIKTEEEKLKEKIEALLYDKRLDCPVCGRTPSVRAVKVKGYRLRKKDSDFYARYDLINPYFYDVWVCNFCGYAAMKSDFEKIGKSQIQLVLTKITPKWKQRTYPKLHDINIAIERYKLALLNYAVINGKSSQKAMTCLKLSWMYRELKNEKNEAIFREQAIAGFLDAYENEALPFYGMDAYTILYLIGDLQRRNGDLDSALNYFGRVITAPDAQRKIKEMARDRRDDIRAEQKQTDADDLDQMDVSDNNEKAGFFTKLLNKI